MTLKKFIGTKAFYKNLFVLALPLAIQQGITNFVSLLDNVMIGTLGAVPLSAVAVVNQLIFILNLAIFGMLSGASIFGAQFFGKGDEDGLRKAFRFKVISTLSLTLIFVSIYLIFSDRLILPFLQSDQNSAEELAEAFALAKDYLYIMLIGLIPFAVVQIYSNTLRDCSETVYPMTASCIAIVVNLIFNYLLIFGKFGFPKLGVAGAAIATVMARYVEMLYIVIRTHKNLQRFPFMRGIYKTMRIPLSFAKSVFIMGFPLMMNEVLWSFGNTFINLNYAKRGLDVLAAMQITSTLWQLFCVIMFAMGGAVSVIIGQKLGAGHIKEAKESAIKLIVFTFAIHILIGGLVVAVSGAVPQLYSIDADLKRLVTVLIMIAGASLPIHAFIHASYFAIRSGGKTVITFLFDSVYTWCVPVMLSFFLCRYTALPVPLVYFIVQFSDIIKGCIAIPMLKSGFWARNIIE